jgi:hypothetical protein
MSHLGYFSRVRRAQKPQRWLQRAEISIFTLRGAGGSARKCEAGMRVVAPMRLMMLLRRPCLRGVAAHDEGGLMPVD